MHTMITTYLFFAICVVEVSPHGFTVAEAIPTAEEKSFRALISRLRDKEVTKRREAAHLLFLRERKALDALPALCQALNDEDYEVVSSVLFTIQRFGAAGKQAIPHMLPLLKHKNVKLRRDCSYVLAHLGNMPKDAARALQQAMDDQDRLVQIHAAGALALLNGGEQRPIMLLASVFHDEDEDHDVVAAEYLGRAGESAIQSLITLLRSDKRRDRIGGASASAFLAIKYKQSKKTYPKAIVDCAIKIIEDPDVEVVFSGLNCLASVGEQARDAVPILLKCIQHSDESVRINTCHVLSKIGEPAFPAIPTLRQALNDNNEEVRRSAKKTLDALEKLSRQKTQAP